MNGGGAGTFTGFTSVLSAWAPLLRPSLSSGFRSLSEGNGIDCDQSDIPTHERYKIGAWHLRITFGPLESIKRFILLHCLRSQGVSFFI